MHDILNKLQWKRRSVQLASLFFLGEWSFYGIFRCPYAVPYIGCGNCPVIQCPGRSIWLWAWIGILSSTLLFGRAFCGWVCPGGMVSEIISCFALLKGKMDRAVSTALSRGTHIALMVTLAVFYIAGNPRWAIPIRTGEFFNSVVLTFLHANPLWISRTLIIVSALALGILIPHFWCRFLCPTGGLLEILKKFSFFNYKMTDGCTDCDCCREDCDLETRPKEENCTNCGACASKCPADSIRFIR